MATPQAGEARRVGLFGSWLWARLVQALVLAFFADTALLWARSPGLGPVALIMFLMLATFMIAVHPIAYGFGDSEGILSRRYLKLRFVPWKSVATVDWRPLHGIKVVLSESSGDRTLWFFDNPTLSEYVAQIRGKATPEIVIWLRNQIAASR